MPSNAFSKENLRRFVETCDLMLQRIDRYTAGLEDWDGDKPSVRKVSSVVADLKQAVDRVRIEYEATAKQRRNARSDTRILLATVFQNLVDGPAASQGDEDDGESAEIDPVDFPPEAFSVLEVLRFLNAGQKSGEVVVKSKPESFRLTIRKGDLVSASSDHNPAHLRLGAILVEQGAINAFDLDDFIHRHRDDRARIGRALEAEELVSRVQVMAAVQFQVEKLFERLRSSDPTSIRFHPIQHCGNDEADAVNLGDLLLG